jgi:hypothetical protein
MTREINPSNVISEGSVKERALEATGKSTDLS